MVFSLVVVISSCFETSALEARVRQGKNPAVAIT